MLSDPPESLVDDDTLADAVADAWLADLVAPDSDPQLAREVLAALHDLESDSKTVRLDAAIALSNRLRTPLTAAELAELSGCTRAAIYVRQQEALPSLRRAAERAGLSEFLPRP
jgi:predicted DNA-binding transcriptional regulator YafY